ncbi:MAG: hypothetical protein PHV97_06445 [Candidatus Omnitrophica bacterium]|nr:hypothetical protein [Candidatus Omnitrophota bacterium]
MIPIPIANLVKPSPVDPSVFTYGTNPGKRESDFFDAYIGNFDTATALEAAGKFHDALYHMNFSVECFFKYAYCIIRKEVDAQLPLASIKKLVSKDSRAKALKAESFGHDLNDLLETIAVLSDIGTDTDFQALQNELKTDISWVNRRYQIRNNTLAQTPYFRRKMFFSNLLAGVLGGIK